jgi:DNA-binding Xre family transcriptional regulator
MAIESKLDEIMQAKNVTVEELMDKTGLPRMTIFNARRGLNVTMLTALKIIEVLNVPLEDVWSLESLEPKEEGEELANISSG